MDRGHSTPALPAAVLYAMPAIDCTLRKSITIVTGETLFQPTVD